MSLIERLINFNTRYRVLTHVLFWLVVYLVSLQRLNPYDEYDPIAQKVVTRGFYIFFSMLVTYYLAYRILPIMMKTQQYFPVVLELVVGMYILMVFSRTVVIYVVEPIVRVRPFSQESIPEILTDIPKLFWHYFLDTITIPVIFIFLKLIKDQYLGNKRTLVLEKQKSESELKALKAQLNPHFLFNTLNNIYSLSLMNSPQTSDSIARLSDILDHLLYRCSGMYVPLSQEIALMHNYIALEKLRYDERLQVRFRHSTDTDAMIAPLILLSLVENAFKHGAGEDAGSPVIDISLLLTRNRFSFEVTNTYREIKDKKDDMSIGLANIRKQLELIYPGVYTFAVIAADGVFTSTLHIVLSSENIN
ncbi:MAG TPA: histidine kinase [Chitinophaga sp.]|uniref:sensor histidine kinase n=1 Tax=Chitinophaga sp. TaxID=1869181 RepID=UPI002B76BC8F|nr:histidine kinase [Chitinophaga sp.]HVI47910.1 histidine kinase [Chitinophaga sp.]